MNKSFKSTLYMAGAFVVALGWYLIFEQKIRPEQDKKKEDSKHLVQIEKDAIHEIEIERLKPGGLPEIIKLKKTGSDWAITSPIETEADGSSLSSMVGSLTATSIDRTFEDAKDLEPFGLSVPTLKIRLRKDAASPVTEILFGKDTPVGYNAYAQITGKAPVYTVGKSLRTSFDKSLFDLRNKKIVATDKADINEVEILNPKESFLLKKGENDTWLLARTGIPVESAEWNKTLNPFADAKAKSIVDNGEKELSRYGLTKPQSRVTLLDGKKKEKQVWLVGKVEVKKGAPTFFVKNLAKPTVFEIEKDVAEKIARPSKEYQSLNLAKFNRFSVNRIRFDRKDGPFELSKDGADWKVTNEKDFPVDTNKVDSLLTTLQDAKVKEYLSASKQSTLVPDLALVLFEKDGDKESEKLSLAFHKTGKEIQAVNKNLPLPMLVKKEDFEKISVAKDSLKKKDEPKKAEEKKSEKKTGE